jgi:FtsZ-binding cell division protein ZapB
MTQIEELQGRILAAMERISAGVGKLEQARAEAKEEARVAADTSDLEQALDEEKTANAQLEERVKTLHSRLKEEEQGSPAADNGDMEALQAELELLRNEVGNTDERDALKLEVSRLKAALESAANGQAAEKEALQTQVAELDAANQQLLAQFQEASGGAESDLGAAVDQAANEAEIAALKAQLAAAQDAVSQGGVSQDAASQWVDGSQDNAQLTEELQELRRANEELRSANADLRAAQANDQAQVNAVLAKLEPLLASAQNLPEGEEV